MVQSIFAQMKLLRWGPTGRGVNPLAPSGIVFLFARRREAMLQTLNRLS